MTSPAAANPVSIRAGGCDIDVSLTPEKRELSLGEPVFMTLRLATACDQALTVIDGGNYRNKFGRDDSFTMTATSEAGDAITPIDVGMGFGGLMGPRPLRKGAPFEKRFLIAHWIDFPRPGGYTLAVAKDLHVGTRADMSADAAGDVVVPLRATTRVLVTAPSKEKLGAAIDALGSQMLSDDHVVATDAVRALSMVKDDRAVAYFAKAVDTESASIRMEAVWGLRPFGTDEAVAALKRALAAPSLKLAAVQTLGENPHPKAWDAVWALRNDGEANVRLTVLHALARRTTPDVEGRLKGFESDASPMVRDEAKRYLRERAAKK